MKESIKNFFEQTCYLQLNFRRAFLAAPRNVAFRMDQSLPETSDIEAIYIALNNKEGRDDNEKAQITAIHEKFRELDFSDDVKRNLSERCYAVLLKRTIRLDKLACHFIEKMANAAMADAFMGTLSDFLTRNLNAYFEQKQAAEALLNQPGANHVSFFRISLADAMVPPSASSSLIPAPFSDHDIHNRLEMIAKKRELSVLMSLLDDDTTDRLRQAIQKKLHSQEADSLQVAAGGGAASAAGRHATQYTVLLSSGDERGARGHSEKTYGTFCHDL